MWALIQRESTGIVKGTPILGRMQAKTLDDGIHLMKANLQAFGEPTCMNL